MPNTSHRIFKILNFDISSLNQPRWATAEEFSGLDGHTIGEPKILFKKLNHDDAEKWRKKFSGETLDFSILDIKVGEILEVEPHPKATHLYVLSVDIGEKSPIKLCAGLVAWFTPEDLHKRKILVLANLKDADIHGIKSEGMILTAEKRKKIDLFDLKNFPIGERVMAKDPLINPEKIGLEDFKKVELSVKNRHFQWEDQILRVSGRPVQTKELQNGKIY
jgi:methionine--tRNA ligase beta chain